LQPAKLTGAQAMPKGYKDHAVAQTQRLPLAGGPQLHHNSQP
jgi:hypothetical protein